MAPARNRPRKVHCPVSSGDEELAPIRRMSASSGDEMFRFGKGKSKGKEKVPPTSNRERGDRPLIPRPTSIHIVERPLIPDAPSSDDDSAEATPLLDIADVDTHLTEDAIDASTSRNQFKTYVEPDGHSGFLPSKPAAAACTRVIRQRYNQSWLTWREIPLATRQMWFREFQADVWWDAEYTEQMWKGFNSRCSKRLSSLLSAARAVGQRPTWISETLWSELLVKWSTEDYKSKCKKAKLSRGSDQGACVHVGGSISTSTIAKKMEKEMGRKPTEDEIFLKTHQKKNKEWVSSYARETYEGFKAKEAEHTQAMQEGAMLMTPRQLWTEHVGVKKGRVYGLGSSVGYMDIRSMTGYPGRDIQRILADRDSMWERRLAEVQQDLQQQQEVRQKVREEVRQEVRDELRKEVQQQFKEQQRQMKIMMRQMLRGQQNDEDERPGRRRGR